MSLNANIPTIAAVQLSVLKRKLAITRFSTLDFDPELSNVFAKDDLRQHFRNGTKHLFVVWLSLTEDAWLIKLCVGEMERRSLMDCWSGRQTRNV